VSERALIAEGLLSKVAERLAVLGHRAITTTGGWSLLSAYPRANGTLHWARKYWTTWPLPRHDF
jgi:hypothetical protein